MDTSKATLDKLRKLYAKQQEIRTTYREGMDAIAQEVETLLGGGIGIGDLLNRLERHYDSTWCIRYAPGQSKRYVWNYAKDRAQWKRLIKMLGVDECELRVVNYLKDGDDFYVKSRHPFALFVSNVNRFAATAPSTSEFEMDAPVIDCVREGKHQPPCTSDQQHTRRRMDEMRRPA